MTTQSIGTHETPSGIGREMEDGSDQIWTFQYNLRGHKVKEIDPVGRETVYVYGTNNVPDPGADPPRAKGGTSCR